MDDTSTTTKENRVILLHSSRFSSFLFVSIRFSSENMFITTHVHTFLSVDYQEMTRDNVNSWVIDAGRR